MVRFCPIRSILAESRRIRSTCRIRVRTEFEVNWPRLGGAISIHFAPGSDYAPAASLRARVAQSFALGVAELAAQIARDPRESRRPGHGALQMPAVYHRDDQYKENDDPES
jgi:hypothetical protein